MVDQFFEWIAIPVIVGIYGLLEPNKEELQCGLKALI